MRKRRMSVEEVRERFLLPDLEVRHTRFAPVMLIGQHRSGTTILGTLLRKYLKVNFGPESQFFFRKLRELPRYGDLDDDRNLRALIADIARERCFELNQFGFSVDVDGTMSRLRERTYPGIIDTIFSDFAHHNGMERWGDKTPEYVLHLPELNRMFPDAQYIHIVRDGRDVALSNFDVFFGAKNTATAAAEWKRYIEATREFATSVPQCRFLEIRYEDVMTAPADVFMQMARFMGIVDESGSLEAYVADHLPQDLKAGNFDKWKARMSVPQQRLYERVAGPWLAEYRYERRFDDAPPLGRASMLLYRLDHYLRKYLRIGAWRDNLYKLRLRLGGRTRG